MQNYLMLDANCKLVALVNKLINEIKLGKSIHFIVSDSWFARSRRSANSWDHYVEVLVVADNKMLLYHQNNLENYVLTLFSTVCFFFPFNSAVNQLISESVHMINK